MQRRTTFFSRSGPRRSRRPSSRRRGGTSRACVAEGLAEEGLAAASRRVVRDAAAPDPDPARAAGEAGGPRSRRSWALRPRPRSTPTATRPRRPGASRGRRRSRCRTSSSSSRRAARRSPRAARSRARTAVGGARRGRAAGRLRADVPQDDALGRRRRASSSGRCAASSRSSRAGRSHGDLRRRVGRAHDRPPVLSELPIRVSGPDDYLQKLRAARVEPDGEERRREILEGARALAAEVGGSIESELDLDGDARRPRRMARASCAAPSRRSFWSCPRRSRRRRCARTRSTCRCAGRRGLMPHFVAVMDNAEDRRGPDRQGQRVGLERAPRRRALLLRGGPPADARVAAAGALAPLLPGPARRLSPEDRARRAARRDDRASSIGRGDLVETVHAAARLSKADLTTRMVREFTDLQGVVGGIYARLEGSPEPVWRSIYDQYRPIGGSAAIRRARRPGRSSRSRTGSTRSPGSSASAWCRRARATPTACGARPPASSRSSSAGAGGVDWKPVARAGPRQYPADLPRAARRPALAELETFFAERLRNLLERRGHPYDEISAVVGAGVWDFADAADRAAALAEARRKTDFRSLVLAVQADPQHPRRGERRTLPTRSLYREDAERQLASRLPAGAAGDRASSPPRAATAPPWRRSPRSRRRSTGSSSKVLVNCPEPELRQNRLALLGAIQKEFSRLADFSEIVVEKVKRRSISSATAWRRARGSARRRSAARARASRR